MIGTVIASGAFWAGSRLTAVTCAVVPSINALSLLFSASIGVLFGYCPVRRAARMAPIRALRHEQPDGITHAAPRQRTDANTARNTPFIQPSRHGLP